MKPNKFAQEAIKIAQEKKIGIFEAISILQKNKKKGA